MPLNRLKISIAAINGFLGTAGSALAAHALPGDRLSKTTQWFIQGAEFQLFHALALLAVTLLISRAETETSQRLFGGAFWTMQIGIIAFSGSLYWMGVMGKGALGNLHWITPIGGLCLLVGWLLIVIGAAKAK